MNRFLLVACPKQQMLHDMWTDLNPGQRERESIGA